MKSKKSFFAIIFFSLTAFFYGAELTGFSFEPEFGFLNGTIFENVWYAESSHSGNKVTTIPTGKESQLDWQLKNNLYLGSNILLEFQEHYSFDFNFKTVLSGHSGIMEDYDWLNPIYWPSDPSDELTNYSIHEKYLDYFTNINFCFGYKFFINKKHNFCITPKFGFRTQNFYFLAKGGYNQYKSKGYKIEYWESNHTVITYTQSFFAPLTGFSIGVNFAKNFETNLTITMTYIKELEAFDDHLEKHGTGSTCYFNDRLENVLIFDSNIKLFFKINDNNKFGLTGSVQYSPKAYGYTYSSSKSFDTLSDIPGMSDLGGSSRILFGYGFIYKFYF